MDPLDLRDMALRNTGAVFEVGERQGETASGVFKTNDSLIVHLLNSEISTLKNKEKEIATHNSCEELRG